MAVRSCSVDHIGSAFLRRILSRMRELGLNRTTLAARMQVSRPYVTKVLKGDVNISFATAAKFAAALKMDFCPELVSQEKIVRSEFSYPISLGRNVLGLRRESFKGFALTCI